LAGFFNGTPLYLPGVYTPRVNRRNTELPTRPVGARLIDQTAYAIILFIGNNKSETGMTPDKPPFRADHVGSLLRPKALLVARNDHEAGRITAEELRAAEDAAVSDAVKMQEGIGLQSVTDGEFRRRSFHMDFFSKIGGVSLAENDTRVTFKNDAGAVEFATAAVRVTGKLGLKETIFGNDFSFLRSKTKATAKLTIPAPSLMHLRAGMGALDPSIYSSIDQFWSDIAKVYAEEIHRLGELGCRYLQLDDTSFAGLGDEERRTAITRAGGDPATQHLTYIRAINGAVANKPQDMSVVIHTCRGNFRSGWLASGGYDYVAETLFNELNVDGFFLEYDDSRSGGFEPLRFVPRNKKIVLGLVTTKHGRLEAKDTIKRRIDEAAKYIPLEQLCLSPQCGFASTVEGNELSIAEQNSKLKMIVEIAKEVWG
jgi:5-methyltetrahydropteroyltriglutamate--homocysteine methyltransferase